MAGETAQGQSTGDKVVAGINDATAVIGTLVPTVAALGSLVRLIATAVRPSEAQKAQEFDAAIAEFDKAKAGLDTAISGFEAAKAAAQGGASVAQPGAGTDSVAKPGGNPVGAMMAKTERGQKPSDG